MQKNKKTAIYYYHKIHSDIQVYISTENLIKILVYTYAKGYGYAYSYGYSYAYGYGYG